ncbi:MAG: GNAT family N-acetyltransferase [Pseudomonadales bacterium]
MEQPTIETERLVLRPFCKTDSKDVQELAGKREVSDTTLTIPHPYKDGMAEEWISKHPANWTNRTAVTYAITDKVSKKLIGTVSLSKINDGEAELGYWIGLPFWDVGYCTEAASALVEFAFKNLDITIVIAEYLVSNPGSGRVMQKMGMRHIGRRRRLDRNNQMAQVEVYEATNTTNT